MIRLEIFKKTTDYFYPNYQIRAQGNLDENQYVKIVFTPLSDGKFRTAVWGADDFAMYRDYDTYELAYQAFLQIIVDEESVTISKLKTMEFERY